MANEIIRHFPQHVNYLEPCGGGAGVLLRKPRAKLETYNDLDNDVVNFFRVLRDHLEELIRKIRLTPWARAEYEQNIDGDEIERARRFFARSWMSIGGWPSGWRCSTAYESRPTPARDMVNNELEQVANRLIGVQIENRDWREVVERYDSPTTLIYIDPPYLKDTRVNFGKYTFEWSDSDHAEAAELLRGVKSHVVLSGYQSPLYAEIYEAHGWRRVDFEVRSSGSKQTESLWLSPSVVPPNNGLHATEQARLF